MQVYISELPKNFRNWAKLTNSPHLTSKSLEPYYCEVERDLYISKNNNGLGEMSNLIIKTAQLHNIKTEELSRWIQTNPSSDNWGDFKRTSMSKPFKKIYKNGLDLRESTIAKSTDSPGI